MNKLIAAIIATGFATIAFNAAADPIVRVDSVTGTMTIILDPVVVIAPRAPAPRCSAPQPLASGPVARTVRVCTGL